MMKLVPYNPTWPEQFNLEAGHIRNVLTGDNVLDIQHIGSTSIIGIQAKPIIDISVLVKADTVLEGFIKPLSEIDYMYYPESSSVERLFFRKGNPVQFHLSITQQGVTPYWERQITFRDHLNSHPELAKEHEELKVRLFHDDPEQGPTHTQAKGEFVTKILKLAKKES